MLRLAALRVHENVKNGELDAIGQVGMNLNVDKLGALLILTVIPDPQRR